MLVFARTGIMIIFLFCRVMHLQVSCSKVCPGRGHGVVAKSRCAHCRPRCLSNSEDGSLAFPGSRTDVAQVCCTLLRQSAPDWSGQGSPEVEAPVYDPQLSFLNGRPLFARLWSGLLHDALQNK